MKSVSDFQAWKAVAGISAIAICALLPVACSDGRAPSRSAADRHVPLITLDTTRADRLGVYGYEKDTSPNSDDVAADGG